MSIAQNTQATPMVQVHSQPAHHQIQCGDKHTTLPTIILETRGTCAQSAMPLHKSFSGLNQDSRVREQSILQPWTPKEVHGMELFFSGRC